MCNHCSDHSQCPEDIARRVMIFAELRSRVPERGHVAELERLMAEAARTGRLVTPTTNWPV